MIIRRVLVLKAVIRQKLKQNGFGQVFAHGTRLAFSVRSIREIRAAAGAHRQKKNIGRSHERRERETAGAVFRDGQLISKEILCTAAFCSIHRYTWIPRGTRPQNRTARGALPTHTHARTCLRIYPFLLFSINATQLLSSVIVS